MNEVMTKESLKFNLMGVEKEGGAPAPKAQEMER